MRPVMGVMIAGIGGASLGTELMKCLLMAGDYDLYGCDISPTAYGLYEAGFRKTFRIDRNAYLTSVTDACKAAGASWLIPGGEQPMVLLGEGRDDLLRHGIRLVANDSRVIRTFSDKAKTFSLLESKGFAVPQTTIVNERADLERMKMPCIVKPSTGSGGERHGLFCDEPRRGHDLCVLYTKIGFVAHRPGVHSR